MVREHKRKTDRGSFNEKNMEKAIKACWQGTKVAVSAEENGIKRTIPLARMDKLKNRFTTKQLKDWYDDSGNEGDVSASITPFSTRKYGGKFVHRQSFTIEQELQIC